MTEQDRIVPEITMSASEVRKHFSEVVNRVANGENRVLVEKHGTQAVAVVSMEEARLIREVQARRDFLESWQAITDRVSTVPADEWEREVENAFTEIRAERRARLK